MRKQKFEFGIDFQQLILQYTVTDNKGYKALELYEDSYFILIHHAIIAYGLKKYYKKKKKVPDETFLRETLRVLYLSDKRDFSSFSREDRDKVDNIISKIYIRQAIDNETILEKVINFARYVKFKEEMENVDINKYDSYEQSLNKLIAANKIGSQLQENYGVSIVSGMSDRAHKRDLLQSVHITPIWQLNKLLNPGGTTTGNIILIAAEAKRFKTGMLINISRLYMRRRKKVIYFDYENGQDALTIRSEQSLLDVEQNEVASGNMDDKLLKLMRKYRRIGAELHIKRMNAYRDTTDDCQVYIDKLWADFNMKFDVAIFDFPDLMAARSGKTEERDRISDAYVDIKEFADKNKFESTWLASHVTREAGKRRGTKYIQNDLAKAIDKIRHVDMALGLQESDEEIEAGVMRLEVIDQRNGGHGAMLFWVDIKKQRVKEFTKQQVKKYHKQLEDSKPERESDL